MSPVESSSDDSNSDNSSIVKHNPNPNNTRFQNPRPRGERRGNRGNYRNYTREGAEEETKATEMRNPIQYYPKYKNEEPVIQKIETNERSIKSFRGTHYREKTGYIPVHNQRGYILDNNQRQNEIEETKNDNTNFITRIGLGEDRNEFPHKFRGNTEYRRGNTYQERGRGGLFSGKNNDYTHEREQKYKNEKNGEFERNKFQGKPISYQKPTQTYQKNKESQKKKKKEFEKIKNYEIPKDFKIETIREKIINKPEISQESSDSSFNDSNNGETLSVTETNFSEKNGREEEYNDLIFENDEKLKIRSPFLVIFEKNHGAMKRYLKKNFRDIKVIRRDNIYYFKGENFERITTLQQIFIDFQVTAKIPKIFIRETNDPKLSIRAIVSSKSFKNFLFDMRRNYQNQEVQIEYITSFDYYQEFMLMSRRSKFFRDKLEAKNKNVGFIRFLIYSKNNNLLAIFNAEEELKAGMDKINHQNDILFFQITLPNQIEAKSLVRKEIINISKNHNFAIKLVQSKSINNDWYIDSLVGALFKEKHFLKQYNLNEIIPIKILCYFVQNLNKTDFELGDAKNILIYKHFLQENIENKGRTMGVEIKLDENNFLLKFSKNCMLYKHIHHCLKQHEEDFIKIQHSFRTLDIPQVSQLLFETIYEEITTIFSDPKQIGSVIEKKIQKINKESSKIKIFFEGKDTLRNLGSEITFIFKVFYEKSKNIETLKNKLVNSLQVFFSKFLTVSIKSFEKQKFNMEILNKDSRCFYFRVNSLKDRLFLVGKIKSIKSAQQYLDSQKLASLNSIQLTVPAFMSRVDIFKAFKSDLKSKKIISPQDRIEINNQILVFATYDDNASETIMKIKDILKDFVVNMVKSHVITDLYPNQIEFLISKPENLKNLEDDYKVQIEIDMLSNKKCHFELFLNSKTIQFINNNIQDCLVDAIVNPHSEMLLSNEFQSEGVNKQILHKAGKKYQEEIENFIKINKRLFQTNILITTAGDMNSCKKIINVSVPVNGSISTNNEALQRTFIGIIQESENNGFESIALPLIGTGTFGFPIEEVFKTFLQVMQENFFPSKSIKTLKEIYLCEIDQSKINKVKNLMSEFIKNDKLKQKDSLYNWKWQDDFKVFQDYDEYINDKIDEGCELYKAGKGKSVLPLYLNIFKIPGTHQFDFTQSNVIDLSKGTVENLQNKQGSWYHNLEIYSNQVSEILNIKSQAKITRFQLFLKSYNIDFIEMKQINMETKFPRNLQKILKTSSIKTKAFELIPFQKAVVFKDEKVTYSQINCIKITSFLETGSLYAVEKKIMDDVNANFEKFKIKIPSHFSTKKLIDLQTLSIKEKIYIDQEPKPNTTITIVGPKKGIQKFEKEFHKLDLPWDNQLSDFQIILLTAFDEEYQRVIQSFIKTLPKNQIKSIKRIQNSELYQNYQESVSRAKKMKEKHGIVLTENEEYEKFLWHGTGKTDPTELIDRINTGLSTQYARDSCMWGRGIYFAENSSYTHNYSFSKNNLRYMLFCKVFVGEFIKLPSDSSLKEPPYKDKIRKILFDSVQGETGGSIIYVLYENHRNYPFYLVEYC